MSKPLTEQERLQYRIAGIKFQEESASAPPDLEKKPAEGLNESQLLELSYRRAGINRNE